MAEEKKTPKKVCPAPCAEHGSHESRDEAVRFHPYRGGRRNRQERAKARAAERAKRSAEEQLAVLDGRPGNAARERARLQGRL